MKVYYIGIIRTKAGEDSKELVAVKDLSSYSRFIRALYGPFITEFAIIAAKKTAPSQRQAIEEKDKGFMFHTYARPEGLCGIMVTDDQYSTMVAQRLLSTILEDFMVSHPASTWATGDCKLNAEMKLKTDKELQDYLAKYQDPQQVDSLLKIKGELEETRINLHKTFESVLQRGEKLDDLIEKSAGLSAQSKIFYQQARKQNSCCNVM